MSKFEKAVFSKTSEGQFPSLENKSLERRALILLKLIDGTTPVSVFRQHLKNFDVPVLLYQLATAGLIKPVGEYQNMNLDELIADKADVQDIKAAVAAVVDAKEKPGIAAATETAPADETIEAIETTPETDEENDIASLYLKQYAPGIIDDDIFSSLSGKKRSDNPLTKGSKP